MELRIGLLSTLIIALTACSPKSDGETEATTTTGTTTLETTGTTAPTSTTAPTTGADECAAFLDQPVSGPPVAVKIDNRRDTPVFLRPRDCPEQPPLLLLGPGGEELLNGSNCDLTCADQFEGVCSTETGYLVTLIRIEPGGVFAFDWSGAVLDVVEPPAACIPLAECPAGCSQQRQAEPGDYTLRVQLAAAVPPNCGALDDPACSCDPNPAGWCQLGPNMDELGPAVPVDAAFTYPADTAVTLLIE